MFPLKCSANLQLQDILVMMTKKTIEKKYIHIPDKN